MAFKIAQNLASSVELNDGVTIPLLGIGTTHVEDPSLISQAVQHGYRLFDTAKLYKTEATVAEGLRKSGISRKDIFILTKLHWDDYDKAQEAIDESLKQLGVDYVDLYLLHVCGVPHILRAYDALQEAKEKGLIRSVGVSNFGIEHLEGLKASGRPLPSVNQIELNPKYRQEDLVRYCRENNITVMGHSPMSSGKLADEKDVNEIAKRYGKTFHQLMLRWSVQKGFIAIPRPNEAAHFIDNASVFDWTISQEDMNKIDQLPEKSCMLDFALEMMRKPWLPE